MCTLIKLGLTLLYMNNLCFTTDTFLMVEFCLILNLDALILNLVLLNSD